MTKIRSLNNLHLILWILVSTVGSSVGWVIGKSLGYFFDDFYYVLFLLTLITICGLFIGLGQWLMLRSIFENAWFWIPATAIGLSFGAFIGFFIRSLFWSNEMIDLIFILAFAGMFTGAVQWFALRRNFFGSPKWIIVSGVSWGIAIFSNTLIKVPIGNWFLRNSIEGAIIGIIVGIISGTFNNFLLIQFRSEL
jgi:hypothetical protein